MRALLSSSPAPLHPGFFLSFPHTSEPGGARKRGRPSRPHRSRLGLRGETGLTEAEGCRRAAPPPGEGDSRRDNSPLPRRGRSLHLTAGTHPPSPAAAASPPAAPAATHRPRRRSAAATRPRLHSNNAFPASNARAQPRARSQRIGRGRGADGACPRGEEPIRGLRGRRGRSREKGGRGREDGTTGEELPPAPVPL